MVNLSFCNNCKCMTKSIRKGRANYACGKCGADKSLSDFYYYESKNKEEERMERINKMRTLKDFSDIECFVKFEPVELINNKVVDINGIRYISEKVLRQEAIKWLKLSDYDLYELGFDKSDNKDDLRKWVTNFLNLAEKDLLKDLKDE